MPEESVPTGRSDFETWWGRHRRSAAGTALLVVSIAVLVYMAMRTSATSPPSAVESVLLVVISSGLQIASAFAFSGNGRADPSLARSAVRRLITLNLYARRARQIAEDAEPGTPVQAKKAMGTLSVQLSYIEEGILEAARDWAEFHPEAIKKLEEADQ